MDKIRDGFGISFGELESVVWENVLLSHREALKGALEALDQVLAESRSAGRYELKGRRVREIVTRAGVAEFERRYYWDREERTWVALLDRALGIEEYKRVSCAVREGAVEAAVEGRSYRGAERELERQAGQAVVSHEAIRQWTLRTGSELAKQRRSRPAPQEKPSVPVLFVEVDGFWPSIQGGKREEVRLLVSHEGWALRTPGSKEYRLVNRKDYVDEKKGGDFWERASEWLEEQYDLSETLVVINGDRASWIRQGCEWFPRSIYQVDRFHLQREMKRLLKGQPAILAEAKQAVEAGDAGGLLGKLAAAMEAAKDSKERDKIRALHCDLSKIPEAIRDYRQQMRDLGLPTEGYQGMGAAEGAVTRYSARLRQVGRSWSREGLKAMLQALVAWFQGTLRGAVRSMEQLDGLEPLSQVRSRVKHRAIEAVAGRLDWARHARIPALDTGTTASGGLSRLFRRVVNGTESVITV